MSTILERAKARAKARREELGIQLDHERIAALPTQVFDGASLVEKWTHTFRRHPGARPLRPIQAEILETAHWAANQADPIGLLGNVGVGKGKTLAFLLMSAVFGADRPLLLIPADMREPLQEAIFEWSQEYHFITPTVLSYSQLSQPTSTALLGEIQPDVIFADECHMLRHKSAARTKRFIRYMKANPQTRFVGMSGTLTGSGVGDYAHLGELALRQHTPLPIDEDVVQLWASVLNWDGEPDDRAWNSVRTICPEGARRRSQTLSREEFYERFRTCPGVVTTQTASSEAAIEIRAIRPEAGKRLHNLIHRLQESYELPDGTPIVDALHFHRAAKQLSMGFYYIWDWGPEGPDEEWLEARSTWASMVREYLKYYSREGVDSPFLVEEYVRKNNRPPAMVDALAEWEVQRQKPDPPVKAIWLDYGPISDAVAWAQGKERAFIWFKSRAVGEMLEAWGIPTFWEGMPNPRKHPVCALSISVYHKGKNFQAWDDQLVLEPPSNAATWEQLLGRTHRQGQMSEVVKADVYYHTWPLRDTMRKAMARSRYIQGMTGQAQKLLLAHTEGFEWDR